MRWKWVLLLTVAVIAGPVIMSALAAGDIPIPAHGPLAEVVQLDCAEEVGSPVILEVRDYDFDPANLYYLQATGVGVEGEPDYAVVFWWPNVPGEPRDLDSIQVYIDRDKDGKAEKVISFRVLAFDAKDNWCNTYLTIVLGQTL